MAEIQICPALVINAPAFFEDPEFCAWINQPDTKFTWHRNGVPTEWSDVIVLVDPSLNGEGSDADMPEHIWEQIITDCKSVLTPTRGQHIMVRLTNIK
jgi:hypothetical protein